MNTRKPTERMRASSIAFALVLMAAASWTRAGALPPLDEEAAGRFAEMALSCVHLEYPNKISHLLNSDADVRPPKSLYPAFYGCYDWHSSVHGHWLLVRLTKLFPDAPFAKKARKALAKSLTKAHMKKEVAYLSAENRQSFERPYGLAWLLQLHAELATWEDPDGQRWKGILQPLVDQAVGMLSSWLPKLGHPIRVGTHSQSAFALGLILDWSEATNAAELGAIVRDRGASFYLEDVQCPLSYEPSGHDFLSPCIAEADFVRRLLPSDEFSAWLKEFLPQIPGSRSWLQSFFGGADDPSWLTPAVVTDPTDGHLVHLDGLNLSRAWMLDGISSALDENDPRLPALTQAMKAHAESGLAQVVGSHYAGSHWLASFAVYLTTRRGIQ